MEHQKPMYNVLSQHDFKLGIKENWTLCLVLLGMFFCQPLKRDEDVL